MIRAEHPGTVNDSAMNVVAHALSVATRGSMVYRGPHPWARTEGTS
jgi:hypothetical protein